MTEIGIHDDNKIACTELQSVDIGSTTRAKKSALTQSTLQNGLDNIPQSELACSGSEQDFIVSIEVRKLFCYFLGSVWRRVVHNDNLPIQVAAMRKGERDHMSKFRQPTDISCIRH